MLLAEVELNLTLGCSDLAFTGGGFIGRHALEDKVRQSDEP